MNTNRKPPKASRPPSKVFALDLGSKNFKLVSGQHVDGELHTRLEGKRTLELGKSIARDNGCISSAKLEEIREALQALRALCEPSATKTIMAIGTRALRIAENREIVRRIATDLDIDLSIADGVREAEVAYLAVTGGAVNKLVSDLGSHSLQVAWSHAGAIEALSVDLGYETAYARFFEPAATFGEAEQALSDFLDGHLDAIPTGTEQLISLSSNTAVSWVTGKIKKEITNRLLARSVLTECLSRLRRLGSDEFRATLADTPRASKIFPGIVVLDYLLDRSGHGHVLLAEVELPVGLIVEHFGETTRLSYDARVAPGL